MRDLPGYLSHTGALLQRVSRIVIPHAEGSIRLPEDLALKSYFVGQIVRQAKPRRVRERNADSPRIVISGGGGGYPGTVDFYNLAIEAITYLQGKLPALTAELIAGPLFRDWLLLQTTSGIVYYSIEPDTTFRFAEADLVICQAGYNTVAELEITVTKTLLVPAERQWDAQFARAHRVDGERTTFRVFRGRTPAELAHQAMQLLCAQIPEITKPKGAGGVKAAQLIYRMLG